MARAIVDGVVIAESEKFQYVEGNVYFPPETVKMEYFKPSSLHTTCHWKGEASYYVVDVNGKTFENAAWFYPEPKKAAEAIRNHVAFYANKVKIEK
jgi:uncharacterized protein (DUF427 family)